MKKLLLSTLVVLILFMFTSRSDAAQYTVIGWNDLGMHCMDHDYSVFAILPPFNNLHAQLIDRSGQLVNPGSTLTYKAAVDTRGSINTTSIGKTNFWKFVLPLFGAQIPKDVGLTGNPVQSIVPSSLSFNATYGFWEATGIPIVPYNDCGMPDYYSMVKVALKGQGGITLGATKTVLPVSDEMRCKRCHKSKTGDSSARPQTGWVNDPNPDKDFKRNILKLHDEKNIANPLYTDALIANGYRSDGLLATSDNGNPILCANCHASNALGKAGINGINPLTQSMHTWHGLYATDDTTGLPLDDIMNRNACYNCHPGSVTQCLRGVMGSAKDATGKSLLQCQSCHGSMSKVGASTRTGWVDLPSCQHCHYWSATLGKYVRDTSVFDTLGNYRQATSIFTTGLNLYKISAGHGNVQCEACHGPTHAEYPTSEANDNLQSITLQGHGGRIAECFVCHKGSSLPVTQDGGPHGLHTIGQVWVDNHGDFAKVSITQCAVCHGSDYRGTKLSKTFTGRNFLTEDSGYKTYLKGSKVSCYDCHNGPGGGQ